jgi:hypothetical protein
MLLNISLANLIAFLKKLTPASWYFIRLLFVLSPELSDGKNKLFVSKYMSLLCEWGVYEFLNQFLVIIPYYMSSIFKLA